MRYKITAKERVMIKSWKSEAARLIFLGQNPGKGFPADLVNGARRKLFRLDAAISVDELRVPPGNRLHPLVGDRAGQWSVSINDQFRICFRWPEDGPEDVEITDYH
jgi:proteic killer suppression protein